MNDGEFQKFCYEEYARSGSRLDEIYRRYPFAATFQVVLTGAAVAIGTNDHWGAFLLRFDVTLYYATLLVTFATISASATALILSVLPRNYAELGPATGYLNWRRDYKQQLAENDEFSEAEVENALATQTATALCERLASAADTNNASTKRRMRYYNWAIYALSVTAPCLAVAAVMRWAIDIRGAMP